MRYLLSDDFAALAKQRTGIVDPTFNDMKDAFWLCVNPLGREIQCPRDGRPGCALVDWIPRDDAKEQTHFMSWTWRYSLSQVQSALEMYQANAPMVVARHVSFFMCFFVNNQFRIVVEGSGTGSQDLECVFRQNLVRTGQMIAILDTWVQPVYLSRVWTIYEQFVASSMDIPVTFLMPEAAAKSLQEQIERGAEGISHIIESVSMVDVANAEAWKPEDETKVKSVIQGSVGFEQVNRHVVEVMVQWIGNVVKGQFQQRVHEARESRARGPGKTITSL